MKLRIAICALGLFFFSSSAFSQSAACQAALNSGYANITLELNSGFAAIDLAHQVQTSGIAQVQANAKAAAAAESTPAARRAAAASVVSAHKSTTASIKQDAADLVAYLDGMKTALKADLATACN